MVACRSESGDCKWQIKREALSKRRKATGKGDEGGVKGGGKAGGGGGGYQGNCYNCARIGHKAAECWLPRRSIQEVQVEEGEEDVAGETRQVGGVWLVGNVDKTDNAAEDEALQGWSVKVSRKKMKQRNE